MVTTPSGSPYLSRAPAAEPRPAVQHQESLRDTIESVVVAFILAFVFRAFVVEAFVIPTGSMASTLYGEHWTHNCSMCGYEFAVGANRGQSGKLALPHASLPCPNCNWEDPVQVSRDDVESGDRILVLKWPLDLSHIFPALGPKRWDVTVFKDPKDGETNFIKRLVGLPEEVFMIIDGDVFVAKAQQLPAELISRLEVIQELNYQARQARNVPETRALRARMDQMRPGVIRDLRPYLRIQRKTGPSQEALWSVVYDHAHPSRRQRPERGGRSWWQAEPSSGWSVGPGLVSFDGLQQPPSELAFVGKSLEDDHAYNVGLPAESAQARSVTDLRVRFTLFPAGGDGQLRVRLRKFDDTFVASFDADGTVLLSRVRQEQPGGMEVLGRAHLRSLQRGQPLRIEVQNVDYRVLVRVDGREILATTDEQYRPDLAKLLADRWRPARSGERPAEVALSAQRLRMEIKHLAIERDVYYRSPRIQGSLTGGNPWADLPGWGTEENPIYLRSGEYFMLGDNSPASEDGRLWSIVGDHLRSRGPDYQVGTVPEDQLIGKAFFVYWPSGYRPTHVRWGLIPNVGRMRWIH